MILGSGEMACRRYINLEVGLCRHQTAVEMDTHTAVEVLLANGLSMSGVSVVERNACDLPYDAGDRRDLASDVLSGEVGVPRWAACIVPRGTALA
jgi:hypothetical protein